MASNLSCNLCGKNFEHVDNCHGINLSFVFGPSSKYDGCLFDGDFCCACIDRIASNIAINCAVPPIEELPRPSIEQQSTFPEEL